jgi:hypothetical protein
MNIYCAGQKVIAQLLCTTYIDFDGNAESSHERFE